VDISTTQKSVVLIPVLGLFSWERVEEGNMEYTLKKINRRKKERTS
jgi:hypothetical protein